MTQIRPELARIIIRENGGWFGPPALLSCQPSLLWAMTPEEQSKHIADGKIRLAELALLPHDYQAAFEMNERNWRIYTLDTDLTHKGERVGRMLVFAGHTDRAWHYIPECWRQSPVDIASYLAVPQSTALQIYAARPRKRKVYHRNPHRQRSYLIVNSLLAAFEARDEDGQELNMNEVERIVGYHK